MGISPAVSLCRFLSCRIQLLCPPLQIIPCPGAKCHNAMIQLKIFSDSVMPRLLLKLQNRLRRCSWLEHGHPALNWILFCNSKCIALLVGSTREQGRCLQCCLWLEVLALTGHSCSGWRCWLWLGVQGHQCMATAAKPRSLTCFWWELESKTHGLGSSWGDSQRHHRYRVLRWTWQALGRVTYVEQVLAVLQGSCWTSSLGRGSRSSVGL